MIGCVQFVVLAPLGFGQFKQWDISSIIVATIAYLFFFIYVIARAALEINDLQYIKNKGWKQDWIFREVDMGIKKKKTKKKSLCSLPHNSDTDSSSDDSDDNNRSIINNVDEEKQETTPLNSNNNENISGGIYSSTKSKDKSKNSWTSDIFHNREKFRKNEKKRRHRSLFYCYTELIAVAASGVATLMFIYQM